ncbi:hypothetical protein D3C71_1600230 [compost metagenome]
MCHRLAKAITWIQQQVLAPDPGIQASGYPLVEEGPHLPQQVVVMRFGLHGSWLSLHVHQAHGHVSLCRGSQGTGLEQGPHVIDEVGACRAARPHHGSLGSIEGDHHIQLLHHPLDHGDDPVQLLLLAHVGGAGAGRLAADVDEGGPLLHHLAGMGQGQFKRLEAAAIGEGVRRHVEDPHDVGTIQGEAAPLAD